MLDTENMQNDLALLDVIKMLAANGETGRLEIKAEGTSGTFSFKDGKLVDAEMGSLKGFQAVNAAVSLRDTHFSFGPSIPPLSVNSFPLSERIVLKRFFGIETVETPVSGDVPTQAFDDVPTDEVDWDITPSKVVPLTEVAEFNGNDSEDIARIEIDEFSDFVSDQPPPFNTEVFHNDADNHSGFPISSESTYDELIVVGAAASRGDLIEHFVNLRADANEESTLVKRKATTSKFRKAIAYPFSSASPSRHRVGWYVIILLLVTAAGAFALVNKLSERREVTLLVKSSDSAPIAAPNQVNNQAPVDTPAVVIPEQQSEQVSTDSSSSVVTSEPQSKQVGPDSRSLPVTDEQRAQLEPESSSAHNLTGEWKVVNTVEETRYRSFDNLEIGFRLVINQSGNEFTAKGEKISENGRVLPPSGRTSIHMTGFIEGDKVHATFFEQGAVRKTNGRFVWRIQNSGSGLRGTFASTAARSQGKSAATKEL